MLTVFEIEALTYMLCVVYIFMIFRQNQTRQIEDRKSSLFSLYDFTKLLKNAMGKVQEGSGIHLYRFLIIADSSTLHNIKCVHQHSVFVFKNLQTNLSFPKVHLCKHIKFVLKTKK